MLFRSKIICPGCQGSRCRESRWLSLDEKKKYPHNSPYRCLDCSHRFLSAKHTALSELRISAPIAAMALILAIGVTYWLTRTETPSPLAAPVGASALEPELKKAAEAGDAGAQFRLGESLLQDPARTPENSASAVHWLQMSAESGNTEAMIVLGRLSRTGVGILQNFGQSAKWIETAAARGNPEGMLELGRLYRDGIGVDKDPVRAYVWFNRASAARNLDAVRERETIARTLTPDELKEAQKQSSTPDSDKEKPARKG
jgi:hypothetical protein